jgi:hypothetical protein
MKAKRLGEVALKLECTEPAFYAAGRTLTAQILQSSLAQFLGAGHGMIHSTDNVLVQREMESCRFLLGTFRPSGGDFQGMRVYRSDDVCRKSWEGVWSEAPTPRSHRRDEPTGLSLGTVASQQSRLPFHPAGSV